MLQRIEQVLCVRNLGLFFVTTCEFGGVSDHLDVLKRNRFY